eukprot:4690561-Amphidinium_carterae.1
MSTSDGDFCLDIGVSEGSSTDVGMSLQRTDFGVIALVVVATPRRHLHARKPALYHRPPLHVTKHHV